MISGGETELDKSMVENIGDPLMHLVRNAMDHGLEQPTVREAKGKAAAASAAKPAAAPAKSPCSYCERAAIHCGMAC